MYVTRGSTYTCPPPLFPTVRSSRFSRMFTAGRAAAPLFGMIGIWAFMEFIEKEKTVYFGISSVFFAMMLLMKPYLGFYLFPVFYLTARKYGTKKLFKNKKLVKMDLT